MRTDRELLLGLLALQNSFISKDQLIAAFSIWTSDKSRSLESILLETKAIQPEHKALLAALVNVHLQRHNDDPERSLASIGSLPSIKSELANLADPDLHASLVHVPSTVHSKSIASTDPLSTVSVPEVRIPASRFRILRPHAAGGLGQVSVALDEELRREVAFKEIKFEFADHLESRQRFVREAEITGALEHPSIVPIYGLGTYGNGRPYYAMRFIQGDSLKDWISQFHKKKAQMPSAEKSLTLRQLLARFIDVCQAMHYAHSRGVLHRDLKPHNVMLGKYGETLIVDWGLAKTLGDKARELTPDATNLLTTPPNNSAEVTRQGSAIGTPAYMSPEQAEGKIDELGPASDIYSLGVTLYHCLTGRVPFDQKSTEEVLEAVRKGKYPRPREVDASIAKSLEAICSKAMSYAPIDRYSSAAMIAQEVERYLADEPVGAFREPVSLRAARWVKKHPAVVSTTVACTVLGLAAVSVVAGLSSRYARDLEFKNQQIGQQVQELTGKNETIVNQNKRLEVANKVAERERSRARATTVWLINSFGKTDPNQDGKTLTVYDTLIRAEKEIEDQKDLDTLNKAELFNSISFALTNLGAPKEALTFMEKAYQIRKTELPLEHPEVLMNAAWLGKAYFDMGQRDLGLSLLESTLEKQKATLADNDPDTTTTMNLLGWVYKEVGANDKALPLLKHAIETNEKKLGLDHRDTLAAMTNLAMVYDAAAQYELAAPLYEEVHKRYKSNFGPQHSLTLRAMGNLGNFYGITGKLELAIPLLEETVAAQIKRLGPDHVGTLISKGNLAAVYETAGRMEETLRLRKEVLDGYMAKVGPEHPDTLRAMANLGATYCLSEQRDLAFPLLEKTLEAQRRVLGAQHRETLYTLNNLAAQYYSDGKYDRASALFAEALEAMKKTVAPDHPDVLGLQANLAATYYLAGKRDLALPMMEELVKAGKAKPGIDHPETLNKMSNLATAYNSSDMPEKALLLYDETLRVAKTKLGPDHDLTLACMRGLAATYLSLEKPNDALKLYEETLAATKAKFAADHPDVLYVATGLASTHLVMGDTAQAIEEMKAIFDARKRNQGADHPHTLGVMSALGRAYLLTGKLDMALPLLQEALDARTTKLGKEHVDTHNSQCHLVLAYLLAAKPAEAKAILADYVHQVRSEGKPDVSEWFAETTKEPRRFVKLKKFAEAEMLYRHLSALIEELAPSHWRSQEAKLRLGVTLVAQNRLEEAESPLIDGANGLFEKKLEIPERKRGPVLHDAAAELAKFFDAKKNDAESAKWRAKLEELRTEFPLSEK